MKSRSLDHVSKSKVFFWGIVISAFIFRLGCVLVLAPYLDSDQTLSVDASSYHQVAQNLVEHHIFTSPFDPPYNPQQPGTFRPPLTPLYLAAIYTIFGTNLMWGRLGLAILSAISCGFTYWIGEKHFGHTIGLIAGSISCVYPLFLLLVLLPLTESVSIFLTLTLISMLYRYAPQQHYVDTQQIHLKWAIHIGIVFGLILLNKAANIVVFPCILFWAFVTLSGTWKIRLARVFIILMISALIILPWAIRNQRIVGAFTPVNSNGGWTFYLGNNIHTEKNLKALEDGTTNGWIPPKEVFEPFADLSFNDTKNYEKRAIRLGREFIWNNPGKFLNFALRKLSIFWSPYNHVVDKITWIPLALLSIIGFGVSLKYWEDQIVIYLLILSTMTIPFVFTSMPRFRAPIMPFVLIYSAVGLVSLYRFGKGLIYANRD